MSRTAQPELAVGNPPVPKGDAALLGLFDHLDFLPCEGPHLRQHELWRTAVRITENAGIADLIAKWRTEDRKAQGLTRPGPTPHVSEAQVFTLLLVLVLKRRPPCFKELEEMVRGADPEDLALVGFQPPDPCVSDTAAYFRLYNTYHDRLIPLLNPEPESLYRLRPKTVYEELVRQRDQEDCDRRFWRAVEFTAAMFHGTWMLLPRKARRRLELTLTIDATRVPAACLGPTNRLVEFEDGQRVKVPFAAADSSAAFYVREGNHDASDPQRGQPWKKQSKEAAPTSRAKTRYDRIKDIRVWAREATMIGLSVPGLPKIVLGMMLDNPGKNIGAITTTLLDILLARGLKIKYLVGDMAYVPGCKAEDLAYPLRKRGISAVFDYPKAEHTLGVTASHGGAKMIEGEWFCPAMPQNLVEASANYYLTAQNDKRRITSETYHQQLAQRRPYALRVKAGVDSEGYQRWQCPAVGPNPSVDCPRRDNPVAEGRALTVIQQRDLPTPAPRCCIDKTLTIPPSASGKFLQGIPYRGALWYHLYEGRQVIESINRSNKRGDRRPIHDRDWHPRRGWIEMLLNVVLLVVATNVAKILAWAKEQVKAEQGALLPKKRAPRRRDRVLTAEEAGLRAPPPPPPPAIEAA